MPSQMVTSIRTVAESIVQVLMLLLQLVIHLLEQGPLELEETMQQETASQLQNMMNEMQVHRRMLEGLISQQGRGRAEAHPSPGALEAGSTQHSASRAMGSQVQAMQVPSGMPPPSIRGQASVIEWSEEESFILEETASVTDRVVPVNFPTRSPTTRPRVNPTPKSLAGTVNPRSRGMTIQEWGNMLVTWGRKHRGKTFRQVMDEDWGYYLWSQPRFGSLPPEHQDFCRYCQVRLEEEP